VKHLLAALVIIAAMALPAAAAQPVDQYDDSQSDPFRVAAYILYPVGYTLEWVIFRPMHWVVAQPKLERVFGHQPHQDYIIGPESVR
jgi:hypothetical protein